MARLGVHAQISCKFAPDHLYMTVGNFGVLNFRRKKENCLFFVKLTQDLLKNTNFLFPSDGTWPENSKIKTQIAYHIKLI